jgi:hypothetical protein
MEDYFHVDFVKLKVIGGENQNVGDLTQENNQNVIPIKNRFGDIINFSNLNSNSFQPTPREIKLKTK